MNSQEFVDELEKCNLERMSRMESGEDQELSVDVLAMIRIALRNELEASELAAYWMPSTPELDVKLALARQVGDEAKHYNLLAKRFAELGGDLNAFDPREGGYSPLFQYLTNLPTSVERLAAGQFTREALAQRRNDMFIDYLHKVGDHDTAQLYDQIIQPDEEHHHELGRRMLLKYAVTTELQEAARRSCQKTLEIAEQLREKAIKKTGIYQIPGC